MEGTQEHPQDDFGKEMAEIAVAAAAGYMLEHNLVSNPVVLAKCLTRLSQAALVNSVLSARADVLEHRATVQDGADKVRLALVQAGIEAAKECGQPQAPPDA